MRRFLFLVLVGLIAQPASAVVLDGSIVGDGYSERVLQTIGTNFGAGFNELAGGYASVDAGNLNIAITGKIESFNKLMLFIDTGAGGGENVITASTGGGGNNVGSDGWADAIAGSTFDLGVAPNYLLIARAGNDGADKFDLNFSTVGSTAVDEESFSVFGASQTGSNASVGASGIGVAFDNSLTGGSIGGDNTAAVSPGSITSGLEFVIPLSAIGSPNIADIKVTAFLHNGGFNFAANQTLGGLPSGTGNLGSASFDLSSIAGDQFFTIIPEPTTFVLAGMALATMVFTRRRQG